jgi:ATP-dependent protease ClpP protease subunit
MSKLTDTEKYAISDAERYRISDIHEHGVDTRHFMIYMQGVEENPDEEYGEPGVEYRMANRFIRNLDILTGIDADRPITVSMKTCGGDWVEGMAMYDAILATPNPVSIVSYTHARSMSSLILQAANKRILMPHSYFMYHEGTTGHEGTPKQVRSDFEFGKHADEQMLNVYVAAIKRSPGKMKGWSKSRIKTELVKQMNDKEDVYLLAGEAIAMGFADEVFSDWDSVTEYEDWQLGRK